MRTLYLDCGMGAAGDMLTAALSELLPDQNAFFEKMNALGSPGVHFEKEKTLVTDKILDSFDLVSLVSELTDAFYIEIKAKDCVEENFNSLDSLTDMVIRLQEN